MLLCTFYLKSRNSHFFMHSQFSSSVLLSRCSQSWRPYAILLMLSALLFLPGIQSLPVTDRDEARYAQASRQMMESGDYVNIRLQDETRYKKPVGIYWLQSASVRLWGKPDEIAAYRYPSALAATLAVVATFRLGLLLFSAEIGLLAAILMSSCLLLGGVAHSATTDACLLAAILLCQSALASLVTREPNSRFSKSDFTLFWTALGAGILIKGPIAPLIAILSLAGTCFLTRRRDFLSGLRPGLGIPVCLLIVCPWFIAIMIKSDGQFLHDSFGKDFVGKLTSGQESHGAPPGYYLLTLLATLWPATLLLPEALRRAWQRRSEIKTAFLLSWILPFWLILELVPTKLPHYILPAIPAACLLMALALLQPLELPGGRAFRIFHGVWMGLWAVVALVLFAALPALPKIRENQWSVPALISACGFLVVLVVLARAYGQNRRITSALLLPVAILCVAPCLYGQILPELKSVWLSRQLTEMLRQQESQSEKLPVMCYGYKEMSLVFELGTETLLCKNGSEAEEFVRRHPEAWVLIDERKEAGFLRGWAAVRAGRLADKKFAESADGVQAVIELKSHLTAIASRRGIHYTSGKTQNLKLYRYTTNLEARSGR